MEVGALGERFPFLPGSRRSVQGSRSRKAPSEFPPAMFDESQLRDAVEHEAGEHERELRDNRSNAAGERLEAALLRRLEQPSTWEIIHRPTRKKFLLELDGKRPATLREKEPYQLPVTEENGIGAIATCFVRYVCETDVSGDRPVREWKRRDQRLVFDSSGDVIGFRDLPEQSLTPEELDSLADLMADCTVGSVHSR